MTNLNNRDAALSGHSFALYDAFTDVPYSGSQAAVVLDAAQISSLDRARIAREIGAPATAFVSRIDGNRISVQFFSTVMELPMCGHGTVCLITRLVDIGALPVQNAGWNVAVLDLPNGDAQVLYRRQATGRIEVMLDVTPASFTPVDFDLEKLCQILGIAAGDTSPDIQPEIASGDFVHLCLAMRDLAAMAALKPDFPALARFCVENGLETVAAFSTAVVRRGFDLHVRDFCPAVGVAESAAAGTTNAALAVFLLRKGLVATEDGAEVVVRAEQGIEMGRPSAVTTRLNVQDSKIVGLQVGGIASRIIEGRITTPSGRY